MLSEVNTGFLLGLVALLSIIAGGSTAIVDYLRLKRVRLRYFVLVIGGICLLLMVPVKMAEPPRWLGIFTLVASGLFAVSAIWCALETRRANNTQMRALELRQAAWYLGYIAPMVAVAGLYFLS